jgi:hypothetical protein
MAHGSVQGVLGGWEQIVTERNELICVEESETEIAVVVKVSTGETLSRVAIPYPVEGCGGCELLLSAKERYLAMFVYSGQSQVGYELFYFRPCLQHICSFGYVFGEGLGPVFSFDESRLGLAWSTNPNLSQVDEAVEHIPTGERLIQWTTLHARELPDGPVTSCNVRVRVGPEFPLEADDSFYPERLEIVGEEVSFQTAWGGHVRAPLPLAGSLTIPGPQRS